jgi:hypothetical protein
MSCRISFIVRAAKARTSLGLIDVNADWLFSALKIQSKSFVWIARIRNSLPSRRRSTGPADASLGLRKQLTIRAGGDIAERIQAEFKKYGHDIFRSNAWG